MESNSGQTISIWMATAEEPQSAPLSENMHADVCIVGAGIAGMSTAYFLTRAGKAVIVLDDGHIGGGMTERTTAPQGGYYFLTVAVVELLLIAWWLVVVTKF